MGCTASVRGAVPQPRDPVMVQVDEMWDRVWKTCEVKKGQRNNKMQNLVVRRTGWRTIRIFVSSTFKDFHQEREILVKKVFPDLRTWCQSRRLHLIECDLRWGVPKDAGTDATLQACLQEIDRCYQENIMPFFVNMTSERIGWVPLLEHIPEGVREEYRWVDGLSVTEMEIMHAAYRNDNPNALFMLRNPSFLDRVPEDYKKSFVDSNPVAPYKLSMLKKMINQRFAKERVVSYECSFRGYNPATEMVELDGLEGPFSQAVLEFFKERINKQYPLTNEKLDPYQQDQEKHEAFMKSKSECVLGRGDIIAQVERYIDGVGQDTPLVLQGGAGSGKSSIMAKIADLTVTRALSGKIPGAGGKGWHVFYHFVGAVPGSTELQKMLKRLLAEVSQSKNVNVPSWKKAGEDVESCAQAVCGMLNNPNTPPVILIVDALNQFDDDLPAQLVTWVPPKLAPQVRCVFSMIPGTPQHKALLGREPAPAVITVGPLDTPSRQAIVKETLGRYNKQLDADQMDSLLSKSSSENPLWLSIACEELRVFGQFRKLSDKINTLADGLLQLEQQVIARFEQESGGDLLRATLCLLECSATGLLETELVHILGDEDNLLPSEKNKDEGAEKDDSKREKTAKDIGPLPAYKWTEVYRSIRPFLRPFGDSGEGRLDFYHRSLSKAVRQRYFKKDGKTDEKMVRWWHQKLADFFENTPVMERKLEEYPHHLVKIQDDDRLQHFLTDWKIVDQLYNIEFSTKLCLYWRKTGFERMDAAYDTALENLANSGKCSRDELSRRYEQVARIWSQCGRYEAAIHRAIPKAMQMEREEFGSRPERMAELHHLQATALDEEMKLEEYMYRSQLPRIKTIIECFENSALLRRKLPGEEQKFLLGLVLNRLAFYYSSWQLRGGNQEMSAEEASQKAQQSIDEAITIFTELGDDVHLGDAYTTKGVCCGRASPEQFKYYEKARTVLLRTVGELHHMIDRLYLNLAIYHEEIGDYYKAYAMFRKWYEVCRAMFGPQHPRTRRPIATLNEPMYRRMAQEQGDKLPAVDDVDQDHHSLAGEEVDETTEQAAVPASTNQVSANIDAEESTNQDTADSNTQSANQNSDTEENEGELRHCGFI